ncbi:RtcB family protein [Oricola nitratireducens]|uniref:RtcB family protein n=1 Tax=Oricola nitratireducens TaxID=2775868 RepID=UPI001868FDD4|nr:RtcB family protein [Oricola nitratireducens]
MDPGRLTQAGACEWHIEPTGKMNVPAVLYADEELIRGMDDKVFEQASNVAMLPGIVRASYAMPDAHWGYGFPIGGVAAFDAAAGGVVSGGGVGFDISCGVRSMLTNIDADRIRAHQRELADALFEKVPAGVGSTSAIHLTDEGLDEMLAGGAEWAVRSGWGEMRDLDRIEERGRMRGGNPGYISPRAHKRQRHEMGTLGSGNHYLEVQQVTEIHDAEAARGFGLSPEHIVVTIHCGSRGLGHQIGTEFLAEMAAEAPKQGIDLPERELACARLDSDLGKRYLGAMWAGINCALANREIIGHFAREVFAQVFPDAELDLLYDVSHNTCKIEWHAVDGVEKDLFIHRKGATRAFGPGHDDLPAALKPFGQPVLIGGSMGTGSHILAGTATSEAKAFSSACHGAGRRMSRHQALKNWKGRQVVDDLAERGIIVRSHTSRGIAEEAPGAYKDVDAVVDAAEKAGLARKVARLVPLICIKG